VNYHSVFIDGVETHDCDVEVYYCWPTVLLGRSHFVVKLRVLWQDVFECQTGDSVRTEVKVSLLECSLLWTAGGMGMYLYFCVVLMGYLILFGAVMVDRLLLLLLLQTIASGIRKCNAKNRVRVALFTAKPPQTHWTVSFPTWRIADTRFLIAVAAQNDICHHSRAFVAIVTIKFLLPPPRSVFTQMLPSRLTRRWISGLVFLSCCPEICRYFSESLQAHIGHDLSLLRSLPIYQSSIIIRHIGSDTGSNVNAHTQENRWNLSINLFWISTFLLRQKFDFFSNCLPHFQH